MTERRRGERHGTGHTPPLQALILAGGLGTRLRGVLTDIPKPMAPVAGRPFLEHLVFQLRGSGVTEIVLSTGHLANVIRDHFGDGSALGVSIAYSHEEQPLGTGGAIKLAEDHLTSPAFLVLNGDSFLDLDIARLVEMHEARSARVTMALASVRDRTRYGAVEVDEKSEVRRFVEKGGDSSSDLINAGIYVLDRSVLGAIDDSGAPVSLEKEVFPTFIGNGFFGCASDGFFIDIGIPADYQYLQDNPQVLRTGGR